MSTNLSRLSVPYLQVPFQAISLRFITSVSILELFCTYTFSCSVIHSVTQSPHLAEFIFNCAGKEIVRIYFNPAYVYLSDNSFRNLNICTASGEAERIREARTECLKCSTFQAILGNLLGVE
jgi:hypothetical protein